MYPRSESVCDHIDFNVFPQTYGESCGRKDQWYYDHECKPYSTSQVRQYTTPYSCVPVDQRVDDTATLGLLGLFSASLDENNVI